MPVAGVKIEAPVAIHVQKGHAEPELQDAWRTDPAGIGDLGKAARAGVAIQGVRLVLEVGDHQVQPAVAIEVAGVRAHPGTHGPILRVSDACFQPDVLEVQGVRRSGVQAFRSREPGFVKP